MQSFLTSALFCLASASPVLYERDVGVYGQGQDVAIDAPGLAWHPAYKGFPSKGPGPKQTNFVSALLLNLLNPGMVPLGVNPSHCTTKNGQPPVILIPGTSETAYNNWAYMGPELSDAGLCVYSFNHNPYKFLSDALPNNALGFMGDIKNSAAALGVFIDEVLALTGADKVDLVGHSQGGGALPYYYLKNLMKGSKVRKHIGLAPSLGTSFYGMNQLVHFVLNEQAEDDVNQLISEATNAASMDQQLTDSSFMKDLHNGGLTIEGVEYVNLATKFDDVLLPYTNCIVHEDNRNITNIVLQDLCGLDLSDHLGLSYSKNVLQIVKNHLFNTNSPIRCSVELPVIN